MNIIAFSKRLLPEMVKRPFRGIYRRRTRRLRLRWRFPTLIAGPGADIDEASKFEPYVHLAPRVLISDSHIGRRSYVADGACLVCARVGRFSSIGPGAQIGLPNHPTSGYVSTHPVFFYAIPQRHLTFADRNYFAGITPTFVGNDVWIGANALVKGGVVIGDGAIIGAGAVVTRDVPPYAIFAGVPAKLLRTRFDEDTIKFLLKLRWWERSDAWLRQNFLKFHNIADFVREFGSSAPDEREVETL